MGKGPRIARALYLPKKILLLLVTVLAQALFTLVRSHLVPFMLFTVGHNNDG